jgi:hypothetical protein
MLESFRTTVRLLATTVILVVDEDDPELVEYLRLPYRYRDAVGDLLAPPDPPVVMVLPAAETGSLTAATNASARRVWDDDVIIGHVGDDHRFRTFGWDSRIADALVDPGVAYGNDLLKGKRLPTAVFMSSVIPRTLGWYALPGTRHMFIDNAWRELGRELGRLRYLPDVVIEHMHPSAGKAEPDAGYAAAKVHKGTDREVYRAWRDGTFEADVYAVARAIS